MNETLKQNRLQRDHVEGSCSYVTEDQNNANDCPNDVHLYKLHRFYFLHICPLYLVHRILAIWAQNLFIVRMVHLKGSVLLIMAQETEPVLLRRPCHYLLRHMNIGVKLMKKMMILWVKRRWHWHGTKYSRALHFLISLYCLLRNGT